MKQHLTIWQKSALAAAVFSALHMQPTLAQGPSETSFGLEEVVVTAQRRTQSLQDVPISANVFDAATIERQNIENLADYLDLTPNIAAVNTGNRLRNEVGLRGISNIGGAQNVVGFYVDEFNVAPVSENATYDQQLIDVERIEVLRGPQSTLFGRNAAAGAISITSQKPSDELEGRISARAANFDTYEVNGAINVPITDTVAIRLNGYYEEGGGFLDNEGPSNATNDYDEHGLRGILRWTPNDRFTADLSLSRSEFEQGFNNAVPTGELLPFLEEVGFELYPVEAGYWPDNDDTIQSNIPLKSEGETTIATARLQYDFDSFSLISVTGYIDHESSEFGEADHTELELYFDSLEETLESWSTEIRLQSSGDSSINWQVGAVYAEDENTGFALREFQQDFYFFAIPLILGADLPESLLPDRPIFIVNDRDETMVTSYGIFGEVSWTGFDDKLTLAAGLRWQHDDIEESLIFERDDPFPPYGSLAAASSGDADFDEWMPRFTATYFLNDDVNFYGSAAVGSKPGGYNLGVDNFPSAPETYDSETLTSYEVGMKGFFLNQRLRLNAALFYLEWEDIQVNSFFLDEETLAATSLTQNAAEAESKGIEIEAVALLTESLQWRVNAGYNDATFTDFPDAIIGETGEVADVSGNRLPFAPEYSFSSILAYEFSLGEFDNFVQLEYVYRDEVFETVDNVENLSDYIEDYEYWNLRAGFANADFSVVAYVENLTDENYVSGFRSAESLSGTLAVVNPRRYGVRLTYNF
ncbi:MAG: TonB-dependent receptor [Pseudomonadota bacterium]